jgi:NADH:ubiquinone oxidoreductase subunit K
MFQRVGGWLSGPEAAALLAVLALATLGTAALFVVGVVGYHRRRSATYLLIAVALGLLVARSLVGFGTALGMVPMPVHHLVEHGSDFAVATLILYALYQSDPPTPSA